MLLPLLVMQSPASSDRRPLPGRRVLPLMVGGLIALLVVAIPTAVTLISPGGSTFGRVMPDGALYWFHVGVASGLNAVGLAPVASASQWIRAASHAETSDDLERTARGMAVARSQGASDWSLDDLLCTSFVHAGPGVRDAIDGSGASCSDEPGIIEHVPLDSPITYKSHPPIGGRHYPVWYPNYGLAADPPVAPGYWVHNLEHGAVVVLYTCSTCADLIQSLDEMYADLSADPRTPRGVVRVLITPYADMDHPLAVVSWGHKLELDQFDRSQIQAFYAAHIDRGPECRNLVCPL
jgi:hypothetical protein